MSLVTRTHAVAIAAFLGALSLQISGIDHWAEVVQPSFIAGVIAQMGAFTVALFSDKVGDSK